MCVDQRNRSHANSSTPTVAKELDPGFWPRLLRLLLKFRVQATAVPQCMAVLHAAEQVGAGHVRTGAHPLPDGAPRAESGDQQEESVSPMVLLHLQLHQVVAQASVGDADSARTAAELYELLNQEEVAAAWWHKAAELGDPDAIDYVNRVLT